MLTMDRDVKQRVVKRGFETTVIVASPMEEAGDVKKKIVVKERKGVNTMSTMGEVRDVVCQVVRIMG